MMQNETELIETETVGVVSKRWAAEWVDALSAAAKGDFSLLLTELAEVAIPAVLALLALFASYLFAKFLARVISAPVRKKVDETLGKFIGKFTFNTVMICALIGVASTVGIDVTSFAAVLAAAGFAIGMAFQGTLGNFAAGILLLVFRPFRVGDFVNVAGVSGKVNEIDLFTVILDTPDNRRIILPNASIASGTIENITFHSERRTEVEVGVCYSADIEQTRIALTAAAESLAELTIQGEGRGFAVVLTGLGASSVDWVVRLWAPSSQLFEAKERLIAAIKERLDAAQIEIPFPQLDVHLDASPAAVLDSGNTGSGRVIPRPRNRDT